MRLHKYAMCSSSRSWELALIWSLSDVITLRGGSTRRLTFCPCGSYRNRSTRRHAESYLFDPSRSRCPTGAVQYLLQVASYISASWQAVLRQILPHSVWVNSNWKTLSLRSPHFNIVLSLKSQKLVCRLDSELLSGRKTKNKGKINEPTGLHGPKCLCVTSHWSRNVQKQSPAEMRHTSEKEA